MYAHYKVMCGCECFISAKIIHYLLLTWYGCHMKQLKYQNQNVKNRSSIEIASCIFETYKNSVRSHGFHIYNTAVYMAMAKMCTYPYTYHEIMHWKFLFRCCEKFPSIVIPSQEANKDTTNTCPIIRFHVYRNVSHCTFYVRFPYQE